MGGLRILVYANAPCAPTGFGTVVKNIFEGIVARGKVPIEDLNFFGINYTGDPHPLPFKIFPAQIAQTRDPDLFGRARFAALALQNHWAFDVLFFLEDTFTLAQLVPIGTQVVPFVPALIDMLRQQIPQGRAPFKVIEYIPIDSDTVLPDWVTWMPNRVDYPVAYTEFGRRVMLDVEPALRDKLTVIPHGTNPETFFPADAAEFKQLALQMKPGEKLVVNVNRNQPRKDVPKTLQMFKLILDKHPEARLYLHMNPVDSGGFNLLAILQQLRIPREFVKFPMGFSEGVGFPLHVLNLVYNAADVLVTTARGEGWGLTASESATVGKAMVAPDCTSYSEIFADGRGVLVSPQEQREVMVLDNDHLRPVANVRAMADAVCDLLDHPDKAAAIGARAREWALRLTWRDHIVPQWERILLECHASLYPPPAAVTAAAPLQMRWT